MLSTVYLTVVTDGSLVPPHTCSREQLDLTNRRHEGKGNEYTPVLMGSKATEIDCYVFVLFWSRVTPPDGNFPDERLY